MELGGRATVPSFHQGLGVSGALWVRGNEELSLTSKGFPVLRSLAPLFQKGQPLGASELHSWYE